MSKEATTDPRDGRDSHGEQRTADGEQTALAEYNAEVLARYPGMVQAFMGMLLEVPEPDDDAAAKIIGVILEAESVEDLDKPWDTDGIRDYFDQVLVVHSLTRRPSDYTGGLGAYLGLQVTLERTGENLFLTCGGVSAVAQLVRAHALGALPLTVVPTPAKKATKQGYWPYHLEIVRRAGSAHGHQQSGAREQ